MLLGDGVIDAAQLSTALAQQATEGGRLGTNLLDLGFVTVDQLAAALAQQQGVPAALLRHLQRADPVLIELVPRALAEHLAAYPVAYSLAGGQRRLVVCLRDPSAASATAIATATGLQVVPCVAAEAVIYALLERGYGAPRPPRFRRGQRQPASSSGRGHASQPALEPPDLEPLDLEPLDLEIDFDAEETPPPMLMLVELDDAAVERDDSQVGPATSQQRTRLIDYFGSHDQPTPPVASTPEPPPERMTSTAAAPPPSTPARAAPPNSQAASDPPPAPAPAAPPSAPAREDLDDGWELDDERPTWVRAADRAADEADEARVARDPHARARPPAAAIGFRETLTAIANAADRSGIVDAVVAFMRERFAAALVLTCKDGLALGHRGFGGAFDAVSVESVVIPMSMTSCFRVAHDHGTLHRGPPSATMSAVQQRFLKLFPDHRPAEVVVAPVRVGNRVVCMFYGHPEAGTLLNDEVVADLAELANATAEGFVRLIREGKQRRSPST